MANPGACCAEGPLRKRVCVIKLHQGGESTLLGNDVKWVALRGSVIGEKYSWRSVRKPAGSIQRNRINCNLVSSSEDPMSVEFLGGTRAGPGGQPLPFSPAVKAGPFVFVSGQVAMGDNGEIVPGGIEAQTRQTLKNVEKALALAGCTVKDVVKSTVWLDDTRDFWTFNRIYAEFFPGNKPARSTTQAKLMVDAKIEIEVIAYKG